MPQARLERALPCRNQILSLARLPVPPLGHSLLDRDARIAEQHRIYRAALGVNDGADGQAAASVRTTKLTISLMMSFNWKFFGV